MEIMIMGLTILLIIAYCLNGAEKEAKQSIESKN